MISIKREEEQEQEISFNNEDFDNQQENNGESGKKKYGSKCVWIVGIVVLEIIVFSYLVYHKMGNGEFGYNGVEKTKEVGEEGAIDGIEQVGNNQQNSQQNMDNKPIITHDQAQLTTPLLYNQWQSIITQQKRELLNIDLTEEQLQNLVKKMQFPTDRPKRFKTNKSLAHIDDIYFAYALSKNPNNQQYQQAEYYHFNKRYNTGAINSQLPMCIVMVGRNTVKVYEKLYQSIKRQNYTNYHIVHIDDNSDDNTDKFLLEYLNKEQNRELKDKTTFIEQKKNKFSLQNRDIGISYYCGQSDVVIDIDSDDWLIGTQVLQLVNTLYQTDKDELWLLYLNNIIYAPSCPCPLANSDGDIDHEMLVKGEYRTSNIWRTTHLRTFLKKLYDKLDKNDFKDKFGNYHRQKSDAFIHFGLVELAAPQHMKTYDEFVYFYDTPFAPPSLLRTFSRLASKTLTPYQKLQTLQSSSQKIKNYNPPQELYNQFVKKQKQYFGEE